MKHRLLSTLLLLALFATVSPAMMDTLWTATVYGEGVTTLRDVAPLANGDFIVVGHTRVNFSHEDFFAARLDQDGVVLWEHTYFNGPFSDILEAVIELPDGNLIAVGSTDTEQALSILCLSADGDSLWSRSYAPDKLCSARDVALLNNGDIAVIGYRLGTGGMHSDVWLMVCDSNGDTLWSRTYGEDDTDTGSSLVQLLNGDLQLCGNTIGSGDLADLWTLRVDNEGNPIGEEQTFGTALEERGNDLFVNSLGDIFVCGAQTTGGGHRGYLAYQPVSGTGWLRNYSDSGTEEQFRSMIPRLGGALCVGWAGNTAGRVKPLVVAVRSDGTTDWIWSYGVPESGSGLYGVERVPSGGAVIVGSHTFGTSRKGFVIRVAPPGGVSGVVRDVVGGDPVPGARVGAVGSEDFVVSDPFGVFSLELLPGTYDIVAYGYCIDSAIVEQVEVLDRTMSQLDLSVGVPDMTPAQTSVNMFARDELLAVGYYTIRNHGSGSLYYSLTSRAISPPGDWITVAPASGTLLPGQRVDVQVQVSADTTDDGIWDYLAELEVRTNSCPDTVRIVPVLITVLETDDYGAAAIDLFALHPAFPNPFNAETRLTFDLPEPSPVRLSLFNIAGQQIRVLADDVYPRGAHSLSVALPDLPSGVYIAHLHAGGFNASQKLVLIK